MFGFILRGYVAITSPVFCVIFFFIPDLLEKYGFDTIFTLSCTINIILICILLCILSDKLKVASNIILNEDNIYNEEDLEKFMQQKTKLVNSICKNVLNRIFKYMMFFTFVTILCGILSKIHLEGLNIWHCILILTGIIQSIYIGIYKSKLKQYAVKMESDIKKSDKFKLGRD